MGATVADITISSNSDSIGTLLTQWNSLVSYSNSTNSSITTAYQAEENLVQAYATAFTNFDSGADGQASSYSLPNGGTSGYIITPDATMDLVGSFNTNGSTVTSLSLHLPDGITIVASGSFRYSGLPYLTPLLIGSELTSVTSSSPDAIDTANTVIASITGVSYYNGSEYSGNLNGFAEGLYDKVDQKYLTINLSADQNFTYSLSGATVSDGTVTNILEQVLNSSAAATDTINVAGLSLDLAQTDLQWINQALAGDDTISLSGDGTLDNLSGIVSVDSAMSSVTVQASAANVSTNLATLETLAQQGKLGAIDLTDQGTPILLVTPQQESADALALAHIVTPYTTVVTNSQPCFAAGTRIATPTGEIPVESLRPGDHVLALADGAWVPRPVRWVGRFSIDLASHPSPRQAGPVRITANAIADGVPRRDLLLSPDHAVFLDGLLVQAQALANGATIFRGTDRDRITYVHVEMAEHSALLAEGLPAESYLDTGNRSWFQAESGVRPLFPDLAAKPSHHDGAFAPLLHSGPKLLALHRRLVARALDLGFTRSVHPALAMVWDKGPACPMRLASGAWRGLVPPGCASVRLLSRSFVPRDIDPLETDDRLLGIAVARIELDHHPLPPRAFTSGWHEAEPDWRWSDGDGVLSLEPSTRTRRIAIRTADAGAVYWVQPRTHHGIGARSRRSGRSRQ